VWRSTALLTFTNYENELIFATSRKTNGSKSTWSEEQEDELQRLYDEFKDIQDAGNVLSSVNSSSLDIVSSDV